MAINLLSNGKQTDHVPAIKITLFFKFYIIPYSAVKFSVKAYSFLCPLGRCTRVFCGKNVGAFSKKKNGLWLFPI